MRNICIRRRASEAKTKSEISVIPRCARVGSCRRRERRNSGRVGTDDDYDDERLGIEFASYLPGVPDAFFRRFRPAGKGPHGLRSATIRFPRQPLGNRWNSRHLLPMLAAVHADVLLRTIRRN